MNVKWLFSCALVLLFIGLGLFFARARVLSRFFGSAVENKVVPAAAKDRQVDLMAKYLGEKISYEVKLGFLSIGKAEFGHLQSAELNGVKLHIVRLETKLARLKDSELIYCYPESLLPARVERRVDLWPKKEMITEVYDQDKFSLEITKVEGDKHSRQVILKKSPIHNAVLLPYYVRAVNDLQIGWTMKVQLPTQTFTVSLLSIEDIKVPAGSFRAYHFQSAPPKFEIWVSADERRIPLKIKGTSATGYTLLLTEYRL